MEADRTPSAATVELEVPELPAVKYPVTGRTSILACPVHKVCVSLDSSGRIQSRCIFCVREARRGMRRLKASRAKVTAPTRAHSTSEPGADGCEAPNGVARPTIGSETE